VIVTLLNNKTKTQTLRLLSHLTKIDEEVKQVDLLAKDYKPTLSFVLMFEKKIFHLLFTNVTFFLNTKPLTC